MAEINDTYDIVAAIDAIENELTASMIRNMKRHKLEEIKEDKQWTMWQSEMLKGLENYKKQNREKYGTRFKNINAQISALLQAANEEGQMDQEKQILRAIKNGLKAKRRIQPGGTAEFFRVNDRKLEALIQATTHDMEKAETAVLRRAEDQYRKIIYNAQVYANTGAGTYEKAVDMAAKDFLRAGINCVEYANGARHTLKDYADMAIRTASKRAYLQGEGVKRQEWGLHLVIMNKRGNPCPLCLPFVGKILIDDVWSGGSSEDGPYQLMSTAVQHGLYHPRCKDSHTTYFPGISGADARYSGQELADIEQQAKEEARQQYAERQAETYRRMGEYALDAENKKEYRNKQEKWTEQAYRPVTRGISESVEIKPDQMIKVRKVDTYQNEIYISDKADIKPRALHEINRNTVNALKRWKISLDNMPRIVIVSEKQLPTAWGKYDAVNNVVYYVPEIAARGIEEAGKTEYHEMWHMKQAEAFRKKYGPITKENRRMYIEHACKTGKKAIDAAGITAYNVRQISDYAKRMYDRGRFDEVEAEYMVMTMRE